MELKSMDKIQNSKNGTSEWKLKRCIDYETEEVRQIQYNGGWVDI